MGEVTLSPAERAQLGSVRLHRDGSPSAFSYPPPELWHPIRGELQGRSLRANPQLDTELCAYTPGETLALLAHPVVQEWQQGVRQYRAGRSFRLLVLVACAKSKPWGDACPSRHYRAYNRLRAEFPEVFWATISEPLGIVPMSHWERFPQYDNPGLFRDDALRSGMQTEDWRRSPWGQKYVLPFDEDARADCIETLGDVVAGFLRRNRRLQCISFVETVPRSTHAEILDVALERSGMTVRRHPKRQLPRVDPYPYLRQVLEAEARTLGIR